MSMKRIVRSLLSLVIVIAIGSLVLFALRSLKQIKPSYPDGSLVIGFYNLENLFDAEDDPRINDAAFLPDGENQWTEDKYQMKLHNMASAIKAMADYNGQYHAILGVAEVENIRALSDLLAQPELKDSGYKGECVTLDAGRYLKKEDEAVRIVAREIEQRKINIKNASIIVSGGYGMGSRENFGMLHQLAQALGGEVGATRAAVDAGFAEGERQIGQTGVTVRPKLYIACGISGAVQHRAGMDQSGKIISINTDPDAPINAIADYTIIGDACKVVPQLIACYNKNKK